MKITAENHTQLIGMATIRINPHDDGRCNGKHIIVIEATPIARSNVRSADRSKVKISWPEGLSLDVAMAEEFQTAMAAACLIARRLRRSGKYEP